MATRLNKQTDTSNVEQVKLAGDARKNPNGSYNGKPLSTEELAKADAVRAQSVKDGKEVQVKAVKAPLYYFEADLWIETRATVVPDSNWLQFQIKSGKLVAVK